MCGRYASARKRQELLEEFLVERDRTTEELAPDYNVAPTKPVYAVLSRPGRGTPAAGPGTGEPPAADRDTDREADQRVARELRVLRWGLVPSWAKDPSIGSRLINARVETLAEKPSFRRAFARRRCLLPADGYYEWYTPEPGAAAGDGRADDQPGAAGGRRTRAGRPRKQPFFIHAKDGAPLALAGLYELWRDPELPDDHPRAWLWTATIITTSAEDEVGRIHDRMPMVIERDRWADWLDPSRTDPDEVRRLLTAAMAGRLTAYPVSTAVNDVRHNGPELIVPHTEGELPDPQRSDDNPGTLF